MSLVDGNYLWNGADLPRFFLPPKFLQKDGPFLTLFAPYTM